MLSQLARGIIPRSEPGDNPRVLRKKRINPSVLTGERIQRMQDNLCLRGQHISHEYRLVCVNCGLVLGQQREKGE